RPDRSPSSTETAPRSITIAHLQKRWNLRTKPSAGRATPTAPPCAPRKGKRNDDLYRPAAHRAEARLRHRRIARWQMARRVGAADGPRRREIRERPVESADEWWARGAVNARRHEGCGPLLP